MVFEKLRDIIADRLGVEKAEITMDTDIKEDLKADSLDLFEVVAGVEDEFGIEIPTDDLNDNMDTVSDMVAYIEKMTQE